VLRLVVALPAVAAALVLAVSGAGASPRADGFPVTVTAANGKVTIAKRPVRIVSLSPTATETLFAIGARRQVVAVDNQSDYPPRAPRTRLSGFTPNAEAIAEYRPDLVVVQFDANRIVAARPGWSRIRAVATGTIVLIDDSIASRWGPRVVNFVRALARAFATLPRA
jgi:ABC-type Fe3+-hydroxamate transport system substrate-binding protein